MTSSVRFTEMSDGTGASYRAPTGSKQGTIAAGERSRIHYRRDAGKEVAVARYLLSFSKD